MNLTGTLLINRFIDECEAILEDAAASQPDRDQAAQRLMGIALHLEEAEAKTHFQATARDRLVRMLAAAQGSGE